MKELDLFKKNWQNTSNFKQVSENDIYEMLQFKSTSILRKLLIISILEFLFWILINVFNDTENYFKSEYFSDFMVLINFLEYFSYLVIVFFIYLLYKKYKKISVTSSTKQLMQAIINTKKIVQYYVWYNLTLLIISVFIGTYFAIITNPASINITDKMSSNFVFMIIVIVLLLIFIVAIFCIFWLFYKLLYGILLNKLYANYNELKKIDI